MTPDDRSEHDMDRDLKELLRADRSAQPTEPPERIDWAVLERARAAAGKNRPWPWTRGWAHNLATAAVVIIAITLLILMQPERQEPPSPTIHTETASPPAAEGPHESEADGRREEQASGNRRPDARRVEERETEGKRPPEVWLESIRQLRAQGDEEAWQQELAAFRRAYPDYPVPEDLTE